MNYIYTPCFATGVNVLEVFFYFFSWTIIIVSHGGLLFTAPMDLQQNICFPHNPGFKEGINSCNQKDRQADGRTDGRPDVPTDGRTCRRADRCIGRQTVRQTGRQADRQTGRQADRQTGRQADRQAGDCLRSEQCKRRPS